MSQPERYVPEEDWTVNQWLHFNATGRRPVSPEWTAARNREMKRFKTDEELTPEDWIEVENAKRRGDPRPRFETPEYIEARREHMEAGGFSGEDDPGVVGGPPEPNSYEDLSAEELEALTPSDHERIQYERKDR